jgi:hypothetical protein
LTVTEGATQSADLDRQARFFDGRCWPGTGYQLRLADDLAGPFDQGGQDVVGAATEAHSLIALQQKPLCCEKPVGAK